MSNVVNGPRDFAADRVVNPNDKKVAEPTESVFTRVVTIVRDTARYFSCRKDRDEGAGHSSESPDTKKNDLRDIKRSTKAVSKLKIHSASDRNGYNYEPLNSNEKSTGWRRTTKASPESSGTMTLTANYEYTSGTEESDEADSQVDGEESFSNDDSQHHGGIDAEDSIGGRQMPTI